MKKHKGRIVFLLINCILIFSVSCTGQYHLYDESKIDKKVSTAVLYKDFDWWIDSNIDVNSIQITRIDDHQAPCRGIACLKRMYGSSWDGSYRIYLLPGEHVIHIKFKTNSLKRVVENGVLVTGGIYSFKNTLKFNAEAGHKYTIKAEFIFEGNKAKAWVEDVTTR